MQTLFKDGDVLLTYGSAGWWPLRRWLLWLAYRGIRAFQLAKWGPKVDYKPTHVRLYLNNQFFEATIPKVKWTRIQDLNLHKKKWKLLRYVQQLDSSDMMAEAKPLVGTKYDIGDLFDFPLPFRLFGDRKNKLRVCSTAAAQVLQAGGAEFDCRIGDVDPAWYNAHPSQWRMVTERKA